MNTPIYDFVKEYSKSNAVRFHMPGHKGKDSLLGIEHLDITEFDGADNLWSPDGIIAESEANASALFGAHTFYSTEGSSLCIRAMLFMVKKRAYQNNESPFILAARNAHKTFINTAAILDIDIDWLMQKESDSYESCSVTGKDIETYLSNSLRKPSAVYITSPDYLGNMLDISEISAVCHSHNIPLLVDNAHGAYLKFLDSSLHPIDLGADMCCDSSHKTLPALTGAAYLHVSKAADSFFIDNAKDALSIFASTSPSYLIMESLDLTNAYLAGCKGELSEMTHLVKSVKQRLMENGFSLKGTEPLKITVMATPYGYTGNDIADILMKKNIYTEYHDDNYIVFMITTSTSHLELTMLADALCSIPRKEPIGYVNQTVLKPVSRIRPSEAIYCESELIKASESRGRILAETAISCPPCVPVYMAGEEIAVPPQSEYIKVIKNV